MNVRGKYMPWSWSHYKKLNPIHTWQHEQPHGSVMGRHRSCRHTVQPKSAWARDHCSASASPSELSWPSSISEGTEDSDEAVAEAAAEAEALLAELVPDAP